MAAEVARVYRALPEEDRKKAAIFGQNYGQAGAVDRFGPALGLPKALSGHLTYHRWASREQVEACHPRLVEFLRLKLAHDPEQRFQSEWWRHYRAMFADAL